MITAYEIRFFQVGSASKGGDAILIRFLDEYQRPTVIVIDGGYKETGEKIIGYLKTLNISIIDLVINTHPDVDHISGLIRLFEEPTLTIKKLLMNRPWRDSNITADYFADNRITDKSVNKRMTEAFKYAFLLEQAAIAKIGEFNILHPVVGKEYFGCLTVLAPSKDLYRTKLLESDKTPTTVDDDSNTKSFAKTMKKLVHYIKGSMLWRDEETTPINETSIVSLLSMPDRDYLLTADAGENGLKEALDYKDSRFGLEHRSIDVLQLPHHGSRKNVTPALIQRISAKDYIISCPPNGLDSHHPSRRLVNMVLEKIPKARIFTTADCCCFVFHFRFNLQLTPQKPLGVFDEIEDYD
jgi:beta-lactamase superfamily II metal-dependent hydrolase